MSTRVADLTTLELRLIAAGYQVKNRISPDELRERYGDLLAGDFYLCAGMGWRDLILGTLDQLAAMDVRVTLVREKPGVARPSPTRAAPTGPRPSLAMSATCC